MADPRDPAKRALDKPHLCHAEHCATICRPEHLMCGHHWHMVPIPLQRAIYRNYRPGQCRDMRPSTEWIRLARRAIDVIKELEEKSHGKTDPAPRM